MKGAKALNPKAIKKPHKYRERERESLRESDSG